MVVLFAENGKKNLHWSKTLNSEIQIFWNIVAEKTKEIGRG